MKTEFIDYFNKLKTLFLDYSPKLLLALILLVGGLWLTSVITKTAKKILLKREVEITLTNFLGNLIFWTLRIMLFVSVVDLLGIKTTSFVAVLGAAGLAVGLSLQGSLANFAGGILIILFKPFKLGDTIEVQGEQGKVEEILIFSTKIITSNNHVVYIPNGLLSNGKIKNHTQLPTRRVDIEVITNYSSNVTEIKQQIEQIISNNNLVLKNPKPDVFINFFSETAIHFSVRIWIENDNAMIAKSQILEKCKALV